MMTQPYTYLIKLIMNYAKISSWIKSECQTAGESVRSLSDQILMQIVWRWQESGVVWVTTQYNFFIIIIIIIIKFILLFASNSAEQSAKLNGSELFRFTHITSIY